MSLPNQKMVHVFLTPPRIGRRFQTVGKNETKTWEVIEVIRKLSHVGHRYEVKAELRETRLQKLNS